jgi:hypothetical protein
VVARHLRRRLRSGPRQARHGAEIGGAAAPGRAGARAATSGVIHPMRAPSRGLGWFCLECPGASFDDVERAAKALRSAWWKPREAPRAVAHICAAKRDHAGLAAVVPGGDTGQGWRRRVAKPPEWASLTGRGPPATLSAERNLPGGPIPGRSSHRTPPAQHVTIRIHPSRLKGRASPLNERARSLVCVGAKPGRRSARDGAPSAAAR